MRPLIDCPNQRKTVSDHFWFWTTPTRAIWVCRIHSPDSGTSNLLNVFFGFHHMNGNWHHLILLLKFETMEDWFIDGMDVPRMGRFVACEILLLKLERTNECRFLCGVCAPQLPKSDFNSIYIYLVLFDIQLKQMISVRVTCKCLPKPKINECEQSKLLLKLHLIHCHHFFHLFFDITLPAGRWQPDHFIRLVNWIGLMNIILLMPCSFKSC